MLAKGLEVQLLALTDFERAKVDLERFEYTGPGLYAKVRTNLKRAYTKLWDTIEANQAHLSNEVWSWRWDDDASGNEGSEKGGFVYMPLSQLPTPDGATQTESNARQLWSLAFLALERLKELEV